MTRPAKAVQEQAATGAKAAPVAAAPATSPDAARVKMLYRIMQSVEVGLMRLSQKARVALLRRRGVSTLTHDST